jgi:hypothetical protein
MLCQNGLNMNDICPYLIQLRGQVNESDLNAMSPIQITVVRVDTASTLFTVRTDQSGLIGLLRHLHGQLGQAGDKFGGYRFWPAAVGGCRGLIRYTGLFLRR